MYMYKYVYIHEYIYTYVYIVCYKAQVAYTHIFFIFFSSSSYNESNLSFIYNDLFLSHSLSLVFLILFFIIFTSITPYCF